MTGAISRNKVVYITYSILDDAGQVFEQHDLPVGYVHGVNSPLLEKIETALQGHNTGDRIEVLVTPEEGFGPHRPELTFTDDIENVPPEHRRIGAEVQFDGEHGNSLTMRVTRIENGKLTVDGNHPLAGKTVQYVVNVAAVRDATGDEIASGLPNDAINMPLH